MSMLVNLSDLPIATANMVTNSSETLVRIGSTDYRTAVGVIRTIDVGALAPIATGFANPTDLFLINRSTSNYNIRFNQVGFVQSTKAWFYQAVAPSGWSIVPNTGDRLLGVATPLIGASPAVPYDSVQGGSQSGTWLTADHALTIAEMPVHNHTTGASGSSGASFGNFRKGDSTISQTPTSVTGGGQAHNHGDTWRPLANVGIICNKDG